MPGISKSPTSTDNMGPNSTPPTPGTEEDVDQAVLALYHTKSSHVRQGTSNLQSAVLLFDTCKRKLYKKDRRDTEEMITDLITRRDILARATRTYWGLLPKYRQCASFRTDTDGLHRTVIIHSLSVAGEKDRTVDLDPGQTRLPRGLAPKSSIYWAAGDGSTMRYILADPIDKSAPRPESPDTMPVVNESEVTRYSQESLPRRTSQVLSWISRTIGRDSVAPEHVNAATNTTQPLKIGEPRTLAAADPKARVQRAERVDRMQGSSSGHRRRPSKDITLVPDDAFLGRKSHQYPRSPLPQADCDGLKSILKNSSEEHDGGYEKRGSVGDSGVPKRAWASAVAKGKRRETSDE